MKYLQNREEYVKLSSQIKKYKAYVFKCSIKNKLHHIEAKTLLNIVFLLLIIFTLINNKKRFLNEDFINITLPKETYSSYENGNKCTYLTKEMVDKFNSYVKSCINNILLDEKRYSLVKRPKISVIIPIYNGGKYLHYSLRSIQNQKMKDIEIILIDDCSTDNSLTIIEKYMKEDERINLIKNIENRKILYSKSIAALNSHGKDYNFFTIVSPLTILYF